MTYRERYMLLRRDSIGIIGETDEREKVSICI